MTKLREENEQKKHKNNEMDELKRTQEGLRRKIMEYQERLSNIHQENCGLKREIEENTTKAQAEIENLQTQLEILKLEKDRLLSRIDKLRLSNSKQDYKIESLTKEIKEMATTIEQLLRDLKQERECNRRGVRLPPLSKQSNTWRL